jgi:hypothetical protein
VGPVSGTAQWNGGIDAFSRINTETNANIRRPAYGRVNGPAAVTTLLDGQPTPVTQVDSGDAVWVSEWRLTLELPPGAHQLAVSARHPSGQFTTNRSVWFTNNTYERVTDTHDVRGKLTRRIWLTLIV